MADATRKSDVDETFETFLRNLREATRDGALALQGNWKESKWSRPIAGEGEGWDGDLFDLSGIGEAFSRARLNEMFIESIRSGESPGVVGDAIITQMQAAYLSAAERAFRMRHTMRRPRAYLHMLSRQAGHGNEAGVFTQALEYVRHLVQEASALTPPQEASA